MSVEVLTISLNKFLSLMHAYLNEQGKDRLEKKYLEGIKNFF